MTDIRLYSESQLPRYRQITRLQGNIKSSEDDFVVEEIPAYTPCGAGEHLYLWIEKRGVTATELTRHFEVTLKLHSRDIGMAGKKDRHAVTRQFISVPARAVDNYKILNTESITVLDAVPHGNKLRTGHLHGNAFDIIVRTTEKLDCLLCENSLRQLGVPNYFGPQRFGRHGNTGAHGFAILKRGKVNRRRQTRERFELSAMQSLLFNHTLAARVRDGFLRTMRSGDLAQFVATKSLFSVDDPTMEQVRCDAGEIVPTGPMFGAKMKFASADVGVAEAATLAEFDLQVDDFNSLRKYIPGARRAQLVYPQNLSVAAISGGYRFRFTLPPGCYATTLLREYFELVDMKSTG